MITHEPKNNDDFIANLGTAIRRARSIEIMGLNLLENTFDGKRAFLLTPALTIKHFWTDEMESLFEIVSRYQNYYSFIKLGILKTS